MSRTGPIPHVDRSTQRTPPATGTLGRVLTSECEVILVTTSVGIPVSTPNDRRDVEDVHHPSSFPTHDGSR